jgi:hypothetical protein
VAVPLGIGKIESRAEDHRSTLGTLRDDRNSPLPRLSALRN